MAKRAKPGDRAPDSTRPGPRPTGRTLDRAPADRDAATSPRVAPTSQEDPAADAGPVARGIAVAVVGSTVVVLLGGVLSITAGLLAVAAATGWAIGRATAGAGARRVPLAVLLAVGAIALGQVGLWLYARGEGGALGLVDYVAQTWGLLVPAQVACAAGAAWLSTR